VRAGETVAAGEVVGAVEPAGSHCAAPCLHWGLRGAGTYLNPLTLLPPWLLRTGPSRLLPVLGVPLPP
jgi:murein DD-endopeptidase MepM/ murein hydrolase activator NlpD